MSKKNQNIFVCQECGGVHRKWSGRCGACGAWDSIVEEMEVSGFTNTSSKGGKKIEFVSLAGEANDVDRIKIGISELDRVLGGGLVKGSAILMGGDPGIGKSTIILQTAAMLANGGYNATYISGEESVQQVRLRSRRLNLDKTNVRLATATSVKDIIASLEGAGKEGRVKSSGREEQSADFSTQNTLPHVLIIDSIQTMFVEEISSAPGTVSQVRASAHELISYTKKKGITLFLIGHVTKEGQIAGPKVLEHMVDTVLYFEGERGHQFRILRAVKNRFGAANEIGVFEMRGEGLMEVTNPSALFLSDRQNNVSGATVFAGMEGTRPVLIEVQALVTSSTMPTPRRAVVGWDLNRLSMVMAILQARYGMFLGDKEVYLNITGGLKITEPALDLAAAVALISAVTNIPLPEGSVIFGELGLSGEVRMVAQGAVRLKEAERLGFSNALVPRGQNGENKGFILEEISHIREVARLFRKEKAVA
jgi:DNA repair protein RadA/Sms